MRRRGLIGAGLGLLAAPAVARAGWLDPWAPTHRLVARAALGPWRPITAAEASAGRVLDVPDNGPLYRIPEDLGLPHGGSYLALVPPDRTFWVSSLRLPAVADRTVYRLETPVWLPAGQRWLPRAVLDDPHFPWLRGMEDRATGRSLFPGFAA